MPLPVDVCNQGLGVLPEPCCTNIYDTAESLMTEAHAALVACGFDAVRPFVSHGAPVVDLCGDLVTAYLLNSSSSGAVPGNCYDLQSITFRIELWLSCYPTIRLEDGGLRMSLPSTDLLHEVHKHLYAAGEKAYTDVGEALRAGLVLGIPGGQNGAELLGLTPETPQSGYAGWHFDVLVTNWGQVQP